MTVSIEDPRSADELKAAAKEMTPREVADFTLRYTPFVDYTKQIQEIKEAQDKMGW
ncbi:MAG: hypothetical protein P8P30_08755 [Rickettsiales bacterium]|nr:hypothetical protein [Rickettsiales bacterium]